QIQALKWELDPAIRSARIDLQILLDPTPSTLERIMAHEEFHVLHCAAPVEFAQQNLQVMLGDDLTVSDLARQLKEIPSLRLVTLAGGVEDGTRIVVAPSLFAAALRNTGIPTVLTYGEGLPLETGAHFAATCYDQLADCIP